MPIRRTVPRNPLPWVSAMSVLTNEKHKKFVTDLDLILDEYSLNIDGNNTMFKSSNKILMETAVSKIKDLKHPVFDHITIKAFFTEKKLPYEIFNYYHFAKYGFYQTFSSEDT
jgi:hypothetical protein